MQSQSVQSLLSDTTVFRKPVTVFLLYICFALGPFSRPVIGLWALYNTIQDNILLTTPHAWGLFSDNAAECSRIIFKEKIRFFLLFSILKNYELGISFYFLFVLF